MRKKPSKPGARANILNPLKASTGARVNGALSPNQIGSMLGITGEAVKQWIYQRRLPAVKLSNGYWKVQTEDLERFITAWMNPKQKVLIFGIEESSLEILKQELAAQNLEPVLTGGLDDAMLKAKRTQPDLLVCDGDSEDSWRLVQALRNCDLVRNVSVLLLVNGSLPQEKLALALELNVIGCVRKPLEKSVIERELKSHFKLA